MAFLHEAAASWLNHVCRGLSEMRWWPRLARRCCGTGGVVDS